MLLWTGPWIGTFTADGMRQMDWPGNLKDAGTGGGFACSCQPTESDCIFAEVSVVSGHSFYKEKGKIKTGKDEGFSWNGYLYTQKAKTTILKISLLLENGYFIFRVSQFWKFHTILFIQNS